MRVVHWFPRIGQNGKEMEEDPLQRKEKSRFFEESVK